MGSFANVFYCYYTDFIKIWLVLWGIMNFPPVKKKSYYMLTIFIQSFILLLFALLCEKNNPDLVTICGTFLVITTEIFLFDDKFFKKFAFSILAYLLIIFLDACAAGIYSIIYIQVDSLFSRLFFNCVNIFTIGVFIAVRWARKNAIQRVNISKKIYALLFAGAGIGIMIISGLMIEANSKSEEKARRIIIVITIIVVITYCAACLMLVFITESRDNYKSLSLINQRVIESQQQYYMLVNEKQQEIRSIRHEMKNHLTCIHGLYQAGKPSEMVQYLNQLIEASDSSAVLFDTGNDIVNAILNDAQSRYRKDNIIIRLEGGFPSEFYIEPMDLCIIMANIITNAVEAIQRMVHNKQEISYIDVRISSYKNDLFIDVKNPVDENLKISKGIPVTSKKDRDFHGFGIKNVIQRVEKYHGTYQYRIKDNQFCVEINIKNQLH